MNSISIGTLAGAGCFRCEGCGFGVALHEMDAVPACPHCGGTSFRRASIFGDMAPSGPLAAPAGDTPGWLADTRSALGGAGHYLAWEDGERIRVAVLEKAWTRLGRSGSAEIRFDDPTVSRRHALIHGLEGSVRILDDRSLNGVFLNGKRIDWHTLADGDQITIGRFDLHYMSLDQAPARDRAHALQAGA